jgi:hypothetical protein
MMMPHEVFLYNRFTSFQSPEVQNLLGGGQYLPALELQVNALKAESINLCDDK